jgi:hypothetical protein
MMLKSTFVHFLLFSQETCDDTPSAEIQAIRVFQDGGKKLPF